MEGRPLSGRVALVTGAGRGIGREIALRLARDGAGIVVHYANSKAGADETVAQILALGGTAIAYQADIARREEVIALFEAIDIDPGRIDIVVNNSGVSVRGNLAELEDRDLKQAFGINTFGPLYIVSEAAKRLGVGGRVVNLGSTMSEFPLGGAGLYSAAKSALKSFTQSWAKELGVKGVTVNMVIPGATSPGMMDNSPEYRTVFEKASPFNRIGRADEIASVVAFLCSPEASWVSGAHILANGAATM